MILDNIKNGDKTQLAVIYKEYRSEFIAWITTNFQCSRDEAREVYQISILALYENVVNEKLQILSSSIKTYLFSIGRNKFLEFKKADKRFDVFHIEDENEPVEVISWEEEEKEQRILMAKKCLEKLGDPCKSLLELYYFHGLSMEEIAGRLSYKNRGSTKNLKYKCLIRLRKLFNTEMEKLEKLGRLENGSSANERLAGTGTGAKASMKIMRS